MTRYIRTLRKHATLSEIEHLWKQHNDSGDVPDPKNIMDLYSTRLQLTHEDYHPVELECVQWITGQIPSIQLVSLHLVSNEGSFNLYNEVIDDLRAMRNFLKFGKSIYSTNPVTNHRTLYPRNGQIPQVLLFQQMDWCSQYTTPIVVDHQWRKVHDFLVNIQGAIPVVVYQLSIQPLTEWFNAIHLCWDNLLREVRHQIFSRTFHGEKDHHPFQQSIHWAGFFYMFITEYGVEDPQLIAIKHQIAFHRDFRSLLKCFIEVVGHTLGDECRIESHPPSVNEVLQDLRFDVAVILDSLDTSHWFEEWCGDQLRRSLYLWIDIFKAATRGDPLTCPKAINAAKVIWNMESVFAALEPTVSADTAAHIVLVALRRNVTRHVFNIVLNGSWT